MWLITTTGSISEPDFTPVLKGTTGASDRCLRDKVIVWRQYGISRLHYVARANFPSVLALVRADKALGRATIEYPPPDA